MEAKFIALDNKVEGVKNELKREFSVKNEALKKDLDNKNADLSGKIAILDANMKETNYMVKEILKLVKHDHKDVDSISLSDDEIPFKPPPKPTLLRRYNKSQRGSQLFEHQDSRDDASLNNDDSMPINKTIPRPQDMSELLATQTIHEEESD